MWVLTSHTFYIIAFLSQKVHYLVPHISLDDDLAILDRAAYAALLLQVLSQVVDLLICTGKAGDHSDLFPALPLEL